MPKWWWGLLGGMIAEGFRRTLSSKSLYPGPGKVTLMHERVTERVEVANQVSFPSCTMAL